MSPVKNKMARVPNAQQRQFNNKGWKKTGPKRAEREALDSPNSSAENAFKAGFRPTSELVTSPFHPLATPWPAATVHGADTYAFSFVYDRQGGEHWIRSECGHYCPDGSETDCRLSCGAKERSA